MIISDLYQEIKLKAFAKDEFAYARQEVLKHADKVRTQLKRTREVEGKLEVETFPDIAEGWAELAKCEQDELRSEVEKFVEAFEDYETWNMRKRISIFHRLFDD